MKRTLFGMVLVFALCALPLAAHAGCDKDTDCKGDRICVNGQCVTPAAAPVIAPQPPPPPPRRAPAAQPQPQDVPPPQQYAPSDQEPPQPEAGPPAPRRVRQQPRYEEPPAEDDQRPPPRRRARDDDGDSRGPMRRRSGGLLAAGIIVAVLGFGNLVASGILWYQYAHWSNIVANDPMSGCVTNHDTPCTTSLAEAATATSFLAPVLLAGGIVMAVLGGASVPDKSRAREEPIQSWVPELHIGPGSLSMITHF